MLSCKTNTLSRFFHLASFLTPSSLSVDLVASNTISELPVPHLNLSYDRWGQDNSPVFNTNPLVRKIASVAAQSISISPLVSFGANSSYDLDFYAPAMQCANANKTQQYNFTNKLNDFQSSVPRVVFLPSQANNTQSASTTTSVFSAWEVASLYHDSESYGNGNQSDFYEKYTANENAQSIYGDIPGIFELWMQVSDESIVCHMVNMSYNVQVNFTDGNQQVFYNNLTVISAWSPWDILQDPAVEPGRTQNDINQAMAFAAHFKSIASVLGGNLTFGLGDETPVDLEFFDQSSSISVTGLAACPEVRQNPTLQVQADVWRQTDNTLNVGLDQTGVGSFFGSLDPSTCRNATLQRATEDLSHNITLSMLSSPILTTNVGRPVTVISLGSQ